MRAIYVDLFSGISRVGWSRPVWCSEEFVEFVTDRGEKFIAPKAEVFPIVR